jgi:hypothetical protein
MHSLAIERTSSVSAIKFLFHKNSILIVSMSGPEKARFPCYPPFHSKLDVAAHSKFFIVTLYNIIFPIYFRIYMPMWLHVI